MLAGTNSKTTCISLVSTSKGMSSFPQRSVSELRPVRKKVTWQVIHFHVIGSVRSCDIK